MAFTVCGVVLSIFSIWMSKVVFSGEDAWLNESGMWMLLGVFGMTSVLAGFAGIMDVIAEKDMKFMWVDMPKKCTGRYEPFMRYERTCPLCEGTGFLEAQKLHDGKINLLIFHVRCNTCGYDVGFPWLSRGFAYAIFYALITAGCLIALKLYIIGGVEYMLELALGWIVFIMLGVVLYMISNYLILRNAIFRKYIDKRIVAWLRHASDGPQR